MRPCRERLLIATNALCQQGKRKVQTLATIVSRKASVNQMQITDYCASPIRRSNAISVLHALRLWKTFQLTPANSVMLAEQADLTLKQCEAALDFLVVAKVVLLRRGASGVFVERINHESEAQDGDHR